MSQSGEAVTPQWHLLSSHARVLVCLGRDPSARLRDVAVAVGLTERAVQNIVRDLDASGFIRKERFGRRNHYTLDLDARLDDPLERTLTVGELLSGCSGPPADGPRSSAD